MTDYNSDQAKELRRARLLKIKPKAAPMMINETQFTRDYTEYRFVAVAHMAELEESNNIMFCPACAKDVNSVMVKRRVLHISYEEDPLGNYPLLAVAKCQGCEWEEMIPVVRQELDDDEQALLRRFYNAQAQAKLSTPPRLGQNSLIDSSRYSQEILRSYQAPLTMGQIGNAKMVEYIPPAQAGLGQTKANRVWETLAKHEEEQRDLAAAKAQLDRIEQLEAEQRARNQARSVGKSAAMGMAYGMGPTRMHEIMRQYQQATSDAMRKQLDQEMQRQLMNNVITHDELTEFKSAPAEAAKSAHKTLKDHITILRDRFDKKDRK